MKFQLLLFTLLFLGGAIEMNGQLPNQSKNDSCATITNVIQECKGNGVTITFYLWNQSGEDATYFTITDGNGWFQSVTMNFPDNTVGITQFTYVATPGSEPCFTIKLYNVKQELCCYSQQCIKVINCPPPCGYTKKEYVNCDPNTPGQYKYQVTIVNPSATIIDQVTIFPNSTADLCINGIPIPATVTIAPIPPGGSASFSVDVTSCSGTLGVGVPIDFILLLESTKDPGVCCHIQTTTVVTPCCMKGDCTPFNFAVSVADETSPDFWATGMIGAISGTVYFTFSGYSIPDNLVVLVNGVEELNITSGTNVCVGNPSTVMDSITIEPCDTVVIFVYANVCDKVVNNWDLVSVCNSGFYIPNPSDVERMVALESEQNSTLHTELVTIFPNPVRNDLKIRTSDSEINYQALSIMDSSGKVIFMKNLIGRQDLQIDVSFLPVGTYLLKLIDDTGKPTLKKFIKL